MNSEKHKFELVLWDLDGTLIDTLEDLAAAVNHALALRGLPLHGVADYRRMVGHGVRNLVRQAVEAAVQKTPDQVGGDGRAVRGDDGRSVGGDDGRAVRGDDGRAVGGDGRAVRGDGAAEGQQLRASGLRMLKEIGFSGTVPKNNFIQRQDGQLMPEYIDAALEDFKEYYKAHIDVHTRPYPGMQELLTELQGEGVKMAVVSNKFQEGTEHLIREFFPDIEFVAILGNRPGYPLKPDPEIVREVLEKAAVEKESAILVGDSPTDMRTAANGGIEAVAVSWGYRTVEELAGAGVAAEAAAGPNTEAGSARAQTGPVAKNRIVHSVEELRHVLRK